MKPFSESHNDTVEERRPVKARNLHKHRRRVFFNMNQLLFLFGLPIYGIFIVLYVFLSLSPQWRMRKPESGIFIKMVDSEEIEVIKEDPDVLFVKVSPKSNMISRDTHGDRLSRLEFSILGRNYSFKGLEVDFPKRIFVQKTLGRSRWGCLEYQVIRSSGFQSKSVLLVFDSKALDYINHGDFIAICDMLKQKDAPGLMVTVL